MISQLLEKIKKNNIIIFIDSENDNVVKETALNIFSKIQECVKTQLTEYEVVTNYGTFICVRKLINNPIKLKKPGYQLFVIRV